MSESLKIGKDDYRIALKGVCARTDFLSNKQYVHTPYNLCNEMLNGLKRCTPLMPDFAYLTNNLEFVEVLCYDRGVKKESITFITDCPQKAKILNHPRYKGVNVVIGDYLSWQPKTSEGKDMKFDVIVGNPPYNDAQENDGRRGGGTTLWEKFIEKSISLLKDGGHLCYVHPCGWRSPAGKFTDTKKLLTSKQIKYLEIHNAKDGLKVFGVGTRYDWYVLKNSPANGKTTVMGEDGERCEINLSKVPFIPNGMFGKIMSLVAKNGEEKCEILYSSSAYESRQPWVNTEKKGAFKHPVIHSIKKGGLNLIYSNTNKNGHFGVPKVVFGCGQSDTFIDTNGNYGLTQHARAIVDNVSNLDKINAAINSPEFIELSKFCCLISTSMFTDRYNKDILATFRKDFWKAFV